MHRYKVAEKLGDGTYGEVLRATNKQSGEIVAIKRSVVRPAMMARPTADLGALLCPAGPRVTS
jgi:hypothetical protein